MQARKDNKEDQSLRDSDRGGQGNVSAPSYELTGEPREAK